MTNTIQDYNSKYFYKDITTLVKKAKAKGHTICIWTANTQPTLVKMMLAYQGIPYDLFNNSPIMNERRKPHFNILLDDICAGGRTFKELAQKLKSIANCDIDLYVTNGFFNNSTNVIDSLTSSGISYIHTLNNPYKLKHQRLENV